jgi:glycine/D-amino acid oxidase-like deaminating enzyme
MRSLSLWWAGLPGELSPRGALERDIDVDVAVVGAGFTGLWTAYYLLRAAPGTRVALLERQVAGYGASGRNGGWCSALFSAPGTLIARDHGVEAARAMHLAMQGTVDEVGQAAAAEGIDCGFTKGGTVVAARTPAQVRRDTCRPSPRARQRARRAPLGRAPFAQVGA